MRPKKVILIIDPNEDRQGITRLVLSLRYTVLSASSICAADEVLDGWCPDLFLGYSPIDEKLFAGLARDFERPSLFVSRTCKGLERYADATLVSPMMDDLLERIAIMSARKRGPKPATIPNCSRIKMAG